jgi:hypothetical protein
MIYQEKFEINDSNSSYFSSQFDILITGYRDEEDERHSYFRKLLNTFTGEIYSFDTCEYAEKLSYKIENSKGLLIEEENNLSLIPDLEKLLKAKTITGSKVCIDITTIKQGLLFLLIKLLTNRVKPNYLFAAYTEPLEYKKREINVIGEAEEYDLYLKVIGSSKSVPGFIKHKSDKPILLVAPIGFDSQRLQTIYENLKPSKLISIVGFPSFVPGWNLTAIKMNFMVLRSSESFGYIENCEASSPFEIYKLLEDIFHMHVSDYDVYVSPLGTRPHCLGAALFASNFSSSYLIYDFPVEKKFRSQNVLKANFYNLTKFIK